MIIEGEECKFIEGTDDFYAVSVTGRVWSFKGRSPRCLKPQRGSNPYYWVALILPDSRRLSKTVHRIVAEAFIPNPNNLPCVNHKNENKLDNRAENLEWCTHEYNMNYGTANNRRSKTMSGEQNPMYGKVPHNRGKYKVFICPLKVAYLRNIKKMTHREIASVFGCTNSRICRILQDLGIK